MWLFWPAGFLTLIMAEYISKPSFWAYPNVHNNFKLLISSSSPEFFHLDDFALGEKHHSIAGSIGGMQRNGKSMTATSGVLPGHCISKMPQITVNFMVWWRWAWVSLSLQKENPSILSLSNPLTWFLTPISSKKHSFFCLVHWWYVNMVPHSLIQSSLTIH